MGFISAEEETKTVLYLNLAVSYSVASPLPVLVVAVFAVGVSMAWAMRRMSDDRRGTTALVAG